MNNYECDILKQLRLNPNMNQRMLAECTGCSVGSVNRSIKNLEMEGYLNELRTPTDKALKLLAARAPKRAVILAAGFGMRMVPINTQFPKALVEVNGEPLIERQIKQLHEVGITEIYVVVGFMKEQFEYLIDQYGVELIVNREYAGKNNLHSLKLALKHLTNCYIIPCDIWCASNPFSRDELYSWYMVSDRTVDESDVRVNRKMELVKVPPQTSGNRMVGIAYLLGDQADFVRDQVIRCSKDERFDHAFWEEALYEKDKMIVSAKIISEDCFAEINTFEQLRELDSQSKQLESNAINAIAEVFHVRTDQITNIETLKKGMTNRSFLFQCMGQKYIMRVPGEGTDQLINRREEAEVYRALAGRNVCDDVLYINPHNGYKITKYLKDARVCDPNNVEDICRCMKLLRRFHDLKLRVGHEFDIFGQINFYESLWKGAPSAYKDYHRTKEQVFSLKPYIEAHVSEKVLTHIDAVPDNFLFAQDEKGQEEIRLIDWEYAGMQDPHVDIAMFCIYSMYNREQVDRLIGAYFTEGCPNAIRIKIYCYIAACGLLWSNWCEFKRNLGVEFGEYSLRQYRFAKDYYKIVQREIKEAEL